MKKLIVTLAALACATSLAFAEPRGGDRGGDRGGHMDRGGDRGGDRGEHRGTNEFRGGEHRGGNFHRGSHGGLERGLYIGDPCWNWVLPIGWLYVCD